MIFNPKENLQQKHASLEEALKKFRRLGYYSSYIPSLTKKSEELYNFVNSLLKESKKLEIQKAHEINQYDIILKQKSIAYILFIVLSSQQYEDEETYRLLNSYLSADYDQRKEIEKEIFASLIKA